LTLGKITILPTICAKKDFVCPFRATENSRDWQEMVRNVCRFTGRRRKGEGKIIGETCRGDGRLVIVY